MVGEDDELQAGARGRGRNVVGPARAVRSVRVNVNDPRDAAVRQVLAQREVTRRKGENDETGDGGPEDRRRRQPFLQRPAPDWRAAALSVRSQVNSGSVRPKWPNAAVFL